MIQTLPLEEAVEAFYQQRGTTITSDPYPLYARLRTEDPVHLRAGRHKPFYIVTRYADVAAVLHDQRFSSDRDHGDRTRTFMERQPEPVRSCGLDLQHHLSLMVIVTDAPTHNRLRRLMQHAFTPRMVDALRRRTQQLVDEALDALVTKGRMDVVGEFARPFAATVKLDMFGAPLSDRERLQRWCEEIAPFLDGWQGIERAHAAMLELKDYMGGLIEERRARRTDDLLGALVAAESEGDRLSEEELFANALGLMFLGSNGVANLIGNGVLALLRHPDQLTRLREDPALIGSAVEEMLRYDSPDQGAVRIAREECELGGRRIAGGQAVSLWIGAANRDPAAFPDPDRFDITRGDNRHLSFSAGPHHCLGAALARMEAQIAIGTLVRRLPDLRLAARTVEWGGNLALRGLKALPVAFSA